MAGNVQNSMQSLNSSIQTTGEGLENQRHQLSDMTSVVGGPLASAVKRIGSLIASAFAAKVVISFGKSCVEAAAQVKALNAQLEQTFGYLEGDARAAIASVAKESGILETRLQSTGTQIYAFAKSAGMDSGTALTMMQEALQVTADSAAFYDRSIEQTAESLRSFLKGNYANDAALGISCTQTTRNIAANKLYGKSFKELSEAQKQLTLLQMVKDANELSGAMGQAARESDGWENVTGNLKESWKQFKAALGAPLLQALVPIIKSITSAIERLTEAVKGTAAAFSELFGWELSTGGAAADIAEDVKNAEDEAQDEIEETAEKKEKTAKSLSGFDDLNILKQPDEDTDDSGAKADVISEKVQDAKRELAGLEEAAAAIDLSEIKRQIRSVTDFIKPLADSIKSNLTASLTTARNGIKGYLSAFGDEVGRYGDRIKTNLANSAEKTRNGIKNILDEATKSGQRMGGELEQGYTDILGGTSIFALSFTDMYAGMLDIVSGKFEEFTLENSGLLGGFFDGLNGSFANLLSTVGGILEDIGTRLTAWWDETGAQAFGNFTAAIFDIIAVVLDLWKTYISPFIDYLLDSISALWDEHIAPLWSGILGFISSLWDAVAAIWNGLLRPLYDTFIKRILVGVMGALKSVWDIIVDVFGIIVDVVRGVIRSAQGLLDFITGIFTGDMEKAVKGIAEFIEGIVIVIWGAIKGTLNIIIDALNTVWSALYGVLKSIVDGIGDFVSLIGDVVGQDWGFSMPDEVPRIPRLAEGGLVRAPTIAIVGDNKNASSDPEVISPLSKLGGMIGTGNEALLMQIITQQREIIDEVKRIRDMDVIGEMDGDVMFRGVLGRADSYKRSHGGRSPF